MTERLRRAIARRKFFDWKPNAVSAKANSWGTPIHKPVCIRSVRRYYRAVRARAYRVDGFVHQKETSSKYVARAVRYMKRVMSDAV